MAGGKQCRANSNEKTYKRQLGAVRRSRDDVAPEAVEERAVLSLRLPVVLLPGRHLLECILKDIVGDHVAPLLQEHVQHVLGVGVEVVRPLRAEARRRRVREAGAPRHAAELGRDRGLRAELGGSFRPALKHFRSHCHVCVSA